MINSEDRNQLIAIRIRQAEKTVQSAEFCLANKEHEMAANRIYYGMFYAVLALALRHGFKTSKHGQLIGWFNREFVKTRQFEPRFSEILKQAFDRRSDADYELATLPSASEIELMLADMKTFIAQIEAFLQKE